MQITTDNKQRLKTGAGFILEFYKITMGAFLAIFVPRLCSDGPCSISQNMGDTSLFHLIAVGLNMLSFLFFLNLYRVELKRENWCIKYLDIDPEKPNEHLDDEIEKYPDLKLQMVKLNKSYKNSTIACAAMQLANMGVSIGDIGDNWAGAASLTPLISYILLIVMKIQNSYFVADEAIKTERAYSAYMSGPKTYNTIDEDHRRPSMTDTDTADIEITLISDSENTQKDIKKEDAKKEDANKEDAKKEDAKKEDAKKEDTKKEVVKTKSKAALLQELNDKLIPQI
jgi:hypothetical protein